MVKSPARVSNKAEAKNKAEPSGHSRKAASRPPARSRKAPSQRDVLAIIENAERAGAEIRSQDVDSDLHLARTLGGIDRDEALAHLEARLGLLERRLEVMLARRDEADEALAGQLEVIRASLQDSLQAAAEQVEEEKEGRRALETQLASLHKEAEARLARIVKRMQERVDKELELGRQELALAQETLATATERFSSQTRDLQQALAQKLDGSDSAWDAKLARLAKGTRKRLDALEGEAERLAGEQEALAAAGDKFRAEFKGQVTSRCDALELRVEAGLDAARRESEERVELAFRELAVSLSATERTLEERLRSAEARLREIGEGMHDGLSAIGSQATAEGQYFRTLIQQGADRLENGLARLGHLESSFEVMRAAMDGLGPPQTRAADAGDLEQRLAVLEAQAAAAPAAVAGDAARGAMEERLAFLEAQFLEVRLSPGDHQQQPAVNARLRAIEAAIDEIVRTITQPAAPSPGLEGLFAESSSGPRTDQPAWEVGRTSPRESPDILPGGRRGLFRR